MFTMDPPTKTGTLDKSYFEEHMPIHESMFEQIREISGHHKLAPGDYVIVHPNEEGDFLLSIFTKSSTHGAK